jgi:thiol-disulfide isomerase/thioredoxin
VPPRSFAAALAATVALACAGGQRPPAPPPLVGTTAPSLKLRTLQGRKVQLVEPGQPTLLVFFSSWCAPSRHEAPRLQDLAHRYAARGLRVVGVAIGEVEGKEGPARFVEEASVEFPIALGSPEVARAYGEMPVTPTVLLVGREGTVVGQLSGMRQMRQLESMVARLVNGEQASADGR